MHVQEVPEETRKSVEDELIRIGQDVSLKNNSGNQMISLNDAISNPTILDTANLAILKVLAPIIDSRYLLSLFTFQYFEPLKTNLKMPIVFDLLFLEFATPFGLALGLPSTQPLGLLVPHC